ncbi:acetyl-CoA carboxylase, biotin carboxylase [Thermodesulfobium narugense DSM 14796]|uniref:Biotin carboxylase n=1 Tax=Thermodesulfobium narugense DSM 14796 TaxID=747365 RepID=M1E6Y3_9BACT|nr:acetyl-CoA carboxylase biotin carboxylase subunit [Thermodesulfobium narugense]AEE13769.1 acetyl-CoA carboxylase, biotin carboxylase [Thermodesulfobium narugense DSM 14796]
MKRILIANRGEIALRIIRALREYGYFSVLAYSEADKTSLPVKQADASICIGPASAKGSYLNIPAIISAVEVTGCDAVHPGYGFLAESPQFARVCKDAGITFIGPSPEAMEKVGDKSVARSVAMSAGVPVVPGSTGFVNSKEDLFRLAKEIGFPLILKAAAGGGGKGMRIVQSFKELEDSFETASNEAKTAFGNSNLYLEKYVSEPRHIEIQFARDKFGNCISLFERECSIQRKHQKLLEESPSCIISPKLRKDLSEAALAIANQVGYVGVGTAEFLVTPEEMFYFIEINARIQVEHPVTEMVTGIDLVELQLLIAEDRPIPFSQDDIKIMGHAIECRINAEDSRNNFRPSPGKVTQFIPPGGPGIRCDTHLYSGFDIVPYYDSLIAKVIAYAPTREKAINRMERALYEMVIDGISTTIDFHREVLKNAFFRKGDYYTNFVQRRMGIK